MTRGNRDTKFRCGKANETNITITGGDPMVGEALEQLLGTLGYEARFLSEAAEVINTGLAKSHLLLLAPGLHAAQSEKILASIAIMPATSRPLVLKLINALGEGEDLRVHYTLWPCQTQHLGAEIETILSKA